ncbi:MAG: baseplate J/gp47 family protein [Patescibacteria group bacterium]|jgi:uncharacterized phage protein gp47/JayE
MSLFSEKTYRAIYADLTDWIIANQDKITDFNEGGVLTSFCEATARGIEEVYLRGKIGFIKYLPELPFYAFGFSKQTGTKSAGEVVFSRDVATTDEITITSGTIVSTPSGLLFVTTETGTIASGGTDSNAVSVEAQSVGSEYNVLADNITIITTPVIGVNSVTNTAASTNGLNEETSVDFEKRFKEYVLGLAKGNGYGIKSGAMTINNVRSVSVVEHFPPLTGLYNFSVYIDDGAGNASAELIAEVEAVLLGDGTTVVPGYKSVGVNMRVLAPTKVTIDIDIAITDDGNYDRAVLSVSIETAISDYINNLQLGEDVIWNEISTAVMSVPGVYDLVLTTPAANTTISSVQIARTGTVTIGYYVP